MSQSSEKFDIRTVKVNFTLGVEEIDMILQGLISLPKERAEGLFKFLKEAATTEINAAIEQHKSTEE